MYILPLMVVATVSSLFYYSFFTLSKRINCKNYGMSSVIVSLYFFFYGVLYNYFPFFSFGHRLFLPISIFFLIGILFLINKVSKESLPYKLVLTFLLSINLLSLFLIASKVILNVSSNNKTNRSVNSVTNHVTPNFYYIVLDGYASNSSLKKYLNFDNSNFIHELNKIGFKVQDSATSNYSRTIFSLTSTLNLNYIQNFIKPKFNQTKLNVYLADNYVSHYLKSIGYNYYLFDSGFGLKDTYDKNHILITTNKYNFLNKVISSSDNDVFNLLINNSILVVLNTNFFSKFTINMYASKILNVYNRLPQIARFKEKKFVFAHIISPHPPFIFDRTGNIVFNGKYDPSYRGNFNWSPSSYIEQLKFINIKTIKVLKEIIENDKNMKVIIVQGDHGSRTQEETFILDNDQNWVQEHFSILNAVYISNEGSSKNKIYQNWDQSSVNTFRILFNEYFESDFQILKNRKYFSDLKGNYEFKCIK